MCICSFAYEQLPTEKNVITIDKTFQAQKLIKFAFWGMLEFYFILLWNKSCFFLLILFLAVVPYDGNMFLLFLSIFIFTARSIIIFVWKKYIYKNSVNLFSNPYETIFVFFRYILDIMLLPSPIWYDWTHFFRIICFFFKVRLK